MRRRSMLIGSAAAVAATAHRSLRAAPAAPGEKVVWPTVRLLDGSTWGAAQAQDKAVVAVFWSTGCPYCKAHNQHVEKLRRAIAGKPLEIVTVVRETDAAAVRRHLAEQRLGFAVTTETAPMAAALSARKVIPLTVTVGRDGRLRQVIPGEMFEEDVLELLRLAT